MKRVLKQLIRGTPLEPMARAVYNRCFAPRAHRLNLRYDRETIQIMEQYLSPDSNCIDIGCNQGDILSEMIRIAPRGRHLAFEPIPELCGALRERFSANPHVVIHNLALSDTAGESTFQYVTTHPELSGLRQRDYGEAATVREITVQTARLDDIVPKTMSIHFVKIDVEGAELQVFRGAIDTIRRNKPLIIFEHGLGAADIYKTAPEDVYELLVGDCGLRITLLENWLAGRERLSKEKFGEQFRRCANFVFLAYNTLHRRAS